MAIDKYYKKQLLKRLTKKQRKLFKAYSSHIADEILKFYSETIRLNEIPCSSHESISIPIEDTKAELFIILEVEPIYS